MSKEVYYKQCKLVSCDTENSYHVAFIPEKFAVKDKVISIKGDSVDYLVYEVYENSRTEGRLIINQSHNAGSIWDITSGTCPRGNK